MKRTSLLPILLLAACAGRLPHGGPSIRVSLSESRILEVPVEEYLLGVLEGELPSDWPLEAMKAQAVASRTYALYRMNQARRDVEGEAPSGSARGGGDASPYYDVEATTRDQVFRRSTHPPAPLIQAVTETEGEVLSFDGALIPAYFHSTCGGINEAASRVWSGEFPPPLEQPHEDPFCEESPRSTWTYELDAAEVGGTLQVLERDETGRVGTVLILSDAGDQELSGNGFREKFGYDKIRSTLFDVEQDEGALKLTGHGSGHGVGLCQWGAKGMAERGYGYREILEFYYPGAEVRKL